MADEELIVFADEVIGIAIPRDTPRTKIISRIINAAASVKDGL